ncbi:MAG: hypothetical protein ACK480_06695 [Planctomycetota bacterium]|jgi:hypothetical protein
MRTQEILQLQASINDSVLRRASELSMAEKRRLGADLFDEQGLYQVYVEEKLRGKN